MTPREQYAAYRRDHVITPNATAERCTYDEIRILPKAGFGLNGRRYRHHPDDIARLYKDDLLGQDYDRFGVDGPAACRETGHVDGCPGKAGGDHELKPGWIAYEDANGFLVEVEVAE